MARTQHAPWPTWCGSRGYPFTEAEEHRFVLELGGAAEKLSQRIPRNQRVLTDRALVTVVATATRLGVSADHVLSVLPQVDPKDLVSVYWELRERVNVAADGWDHLVKDPCGQGAFARAQEAALLVPRPVQSVISVHDEEDRQAAAAIAREDVAKRTNLVIEMSAACTGGTMKSVTTPEGRLLWDDPFALPRLVGQLTPARLTLLLGEQ